MAEKDRKVRVTRKMYLPFEGTQSATVLVAVPGDDVPESLVKQVEAFEASLQEVAEPEEVVEPATSAPKPKPGPPAKNQE